MTISIRELFTKHQFLRPNFYNFAQFTASQIHIVRMSYLLCSAQFAQETTFQILPVSHRWELAIITGCVDRPTQLLNLLSLFKIIPSHTLELNSYRFDTVVDSEGEGFDVPIESASEYSFT